MSFIETLPYLSHSTNELLEQIDFFRLDASSKINEAHRSEYGQFLTPAPVAHLMASLLTCDTPHVVLLDAGAGIGSLFSAVVAMLCRRLNPPKTIHVVSYEREPLFFDYLQNTIQLCQAACRLSNIEFTSTIINADFISHTVDHLTNPLFQSSQPAITCAILNPPYRKIPSNSIERRLLRRAGIETSNLYTGFLALAMKSLQPNGELVAITPRSFCNGSYFKPFRNLFLNTMVLRHIHIFDSRTHVFHDDQVLQENIIFSAAKTNAIPEHIVITSSGHAEDDMPTFREIPYQQIVHPRDPHMFIHVIPDSVGQKVAATFEQFQTSLEDLGLQVSTGRVVDFRAAPFLRMHPDNETAALIYPSHITANQIIWPSTKNRKPNALVLNQETRELFVPNECYVLVKRFTAKEEHRRVVAAVYDPSKIPGTVIGFENHLNYIHHNGNGLEQTLARGLVAFLNSTLVDTYVRQFNGHTQVNATDLRRLRYPTREQLLSLGNHVGTSSLSQHALDNLIAQEIVMTDTLSEQDPIQIKKRIDEARQILHDLGMPRTQQNERSALTLLALLELTPDMSWSEARNPLCGITPMMDFFARYYGKQYKPNTRETVRRQTVHQFLDAGLIRENPDQPDRPINSPRSVYQIEPSTLDLLRSYATEQWEQNLRTCLTSTETLKRRYAQEREMQRIPVTLPTGEMVKLSPGGQNILIEQIINVFASHFTPGGEVLYIGDTDKKFAFFAEERLRSLCVTVDTHGKMPDVIIYDTVRNWLVLVEAVTSHGPIDPKRRGELEHMFATATVGLVFVTAFLTRQAMKEYLPDISWETEVWIAEAPSHLIHFNGKRFLSSHKDSSS